MSDPVTPFDWGRMLIGDAPPLFFLEVALRTLITFGWLLLMLRLTGKRGLAQLSPLELAIVIGLGSAAGDPMFYDDVPLLHALFVITLVVGLQRLLARLIIRSETVETFMEGQPVELLRGGVLDCQGMAQADLSYEDVFERLRQEGVRQLGQVQRLYFEQDGNLSLFCHPDAAQAPPGLPIVPPWDLEPPPPLRPGEPGPAACLRCGRLRNVEQEGAPGPCTCGGTAWTRARRDPLDPEH